MTFANWQLACRHSRQDNTETGWGVCYEPPSLSLGTLDTLPAVPDFELMRVPSLTPEQLAAQAIISRKKGLEWGATTHRTDLLEKLEANRVDTDTPEKKICKMSSIFRMISDFIQYEYGFQDCDIEVFIDAALESYLLRKR